MVLSMVFPNVRGIEDSLIWNIKISYDFLIVYQCQVSLSWAKEI